ncbi:MAG: TonB-dependent receptor [Sphingomonadales bacterium]|nr:TonB-dependent receptor [Sphingomonadales bacterium]
MRLACAPPTGPWGIEGQVRGSSHRAFGCDPIPGAPSRKRDWNVKKTTLTALKVGAAPLVLGLAFVSNAAHAQNAAKVDCAANPNDASCVEDKGQIVVTGSIVRNPAAATASPVTSLSADDLSKRGISSMADALQSLTANNAGTAPPSWSSFGFATGASAVSLRGLNDAYTLTLFNGMRTAPYPLADDGYRNFVDINTIPSSIVDSIDVLQDGASATYGSDAIAGVVNVMIKRQVKGLHLAGSAGISGVGDAGERKISGTFGYGDLEEQGFNVYVNGEYQKNDALKLSARGYPFNTANQSLICGTSAQGCLFNGIRNGVQPDGTASAFTSTMIPFVRPYTAGLSALGPNQMANPAQGCGLLPSHTLTAAELATLTAAQRAAIPANGVVCQQDNANLYRYYNSVTERKGGNIRATFKLGDRAEAYGMFNYYNTITDNFTTPTGYTGQTTPGDVQVTVSRIFLPAYVCSAGTSAIVGGDLIASGCNAANGTLNPNNPFAAAGNLARLTALPAIPRETYANSKVYRFTAGVSATFGDGWNFNLDGTHSTAVLDRTDKGYIMVQGLMDAVAKGTFNFIDPAANSAAQIQGVFPDSHNHSTSKLTQVVASLNKDVFELPGGMLNIAVSGQYRYEAIHNPSANPAMANDAARYYSINAVGVDGSRSVWSASYEISAPIHEMLRVKAEGSYDHYSTHQARFSPKFEAEFKPIPEVKLRGTFSKGFRIPSFSESFALPTTGYVNSNINCANAAVYGAFCAAHASNPAYYSGGYSYGLTSGGNLNLKPEVSTGFTGGIVIQPTPRITFTADYYSIKIDNLIVGVSATQAMINSYYQNNGAVNIPGISVTAALPDPNNPNALPLLGNIIGSYKNADKFVARGMDFSAKAKFPLSNTVTWTTTASASMLLRLEQTLDDGTVQRYDASLGNCNITSCSGAPKWRVVWQNTLDFNDKVGVSLTANYTSGYSEVATDSGGVYGNCQASVDNGQVLGWNDGSPVQCYAKSTFYLDGHIEAKVAPKFKIYMDIKNIFDRKADYEPNAAYGLYQFNPAWQDSLFIGRYFRVGAKVDF